jgi:hypothetical protein
VAVRPPLNAIFVMINAEAPASGPFLLSACF